MYFVHSTLDSLAWITAQDTLRVVPIGAEAETETQTDATQQDKDGEINRSSISFLCQRIARGEYKFSETSAGIYDAALSKRNKLFTHPSYADQVEIINEISVVLQYLLLCIYIVCESDADKVMKDLKDCMSPIGEGSPSIHADAVTSASLSSRLHALTHCVSTCDTLWALFDAALAIPEHHNSSSSSMIGDGGADATPTTTTVPAASAAPIVRMNTIQNETPFSVTDDIVAGTGFHKFFILPASATERDMYQRISANATASSLLLAHSAVQFHRIDCCSIVQPHFLLSLLRTPSDSFVAIYDEVNDLPFVPVQKKNEQDHESNQNDSIDMNARKVRAFMEDMVRRRVEMISGNYPPLTAIQEEYSKRISAFIRADLPMM